MKLPNILTLSRFVLTAVFVACLSISFPGAQLAAVLVFGLAALTDALDGYFARKVYGCSTFGTLMDPLADKVLTAAALIGFVQMFLVPAWMVTLIISREMMVTGLRLLAAEKGVVLAAGLWGKQKTIWQMTFISIILLAGAFNLLDLIDPFIWWGALAVTAITVWSGIVYFHQNLPLLRN